MCDMIIEKQSLGLLGVFSFKLPSHIDRRGGFTKIYASSKFEQAFSQFTIKEQYYTRSSKKVVRGLHFQEPPNEHIKIVQCLSGTIFDVILDLRIKSPTYKQHVSIELKSTEPTCVYIPKGCAHGFMSMVEDSTVLYSVSSEYSPGSDKGVHWQSAGIKWPQIGVPIVSDRDQAHPELNRYSSPFIEDL